MSGLYLYCITPPGITPGADMRGVRGAQVVSHAATDVEVWYSRLDEPPQPGLESVREHNAVVSAALASGVTPLPVRFGQWLADEDALVAHLESAGAGYRERLAELGGTVELGLRCRQRRDGATEVVADKPVTGRQYMAALAAKHAAEKEHSARGQEIAASVRSQLAHVILRERVDALEPPGVVSIAHLVRRPDESVYRAGVHDLSRGWPDVDVIVTGPWPPYSFAG